MRSCIYQGKVSHTRFKPKRHQFEYTLFMMYLDLDEVETALDRFVFWSATKPALAQFKRSDHSGDINESLSDTVRNLIKQQTGQIHNGPIRLLTHCRYFGYCFNPVSFYYCWNQADTKLEYIVAEVSNTPWYEMHCYVLDMRQQQAGKKIDKHIFTKDFHVSPFMDMKQQYHWSLSQPDESLLIKMENFEEDKKFFNAFMRMQRKPMTQWNMFSILVKFPFMTVKVISGIYWQALKLWLKKIPYYSHPKNLSEEISS